MNPIHLNAAEAIIEPFWDPELSEFDKWKIDFPGKGAVSYEQTWCMVGFKWMKADINEDVFVMSRKYDAMDVSKVDILSVSASMRKGNYLNVTVTGKGNKACGHFVCKEDKKQEFAIDISGLSVIDEITISVGSSLWKDGSCWFNWIGLVDSVLLEKYLGTKKDFSEATWEKHLRPMDFEPEFKPSYGILINERELEGIRARTDEAGKLLADADEIEDFYNPESQINDYVNFLQDTRYNRERDEGNIIIGKGERAAIAGIVQKDRQLLRLAARYALSLASCGRWDDGFICDFSTSSFNHRCFVQSLCLYECALILDLAGEMFTETGKNYVLRKMAEEGIGTISYNTWSYEYIFHCNQMAWFSPGRMYGYAVLKENWPRVQKYMDIALSDVVENIENTVEDDGGYLEGPTYFSCVGRDALLALYIYSRSNSVDISSIIPKKLAQSVVFAEATESTDDFLDFIPICDAGYKIKPSFLDKYKIHLAFMATIYKDSVWPSIYQKHKSNHGLGEDPFAWILDEQIPTDNGYIRNNYIQMDVTGHVASLRRTAGGFSKIMIPGNKAGAGHTHCDKGSFIYEYNGETFLMDPGICSYDNPISLELKGPDRHNMLVPVADDEIPYPANPIMADIIPKAWGNEIEFHSTTNLVQGWEPWYEKWTREITSTSPERIVVEDDYILRKGSGVAMVLNTPLEVFEREGKVAITGETGELWISVPKDCTYSIEKMEHPVVTHNRIRIFKTGQKGKLVIELAMKDM